MSTKNNIWNIVSSVSGAVAAIAALITIYFALSTINEEKYFKKPYFELEAPGIKIQNANSQSYRIQITMRNVGIHPANELTGKIIIIDGSLTLKPNYIFNFSISNDLPPNSPTPWCQDNVSLPININTQFIVVYIKYTDAIFNKEYSQSFYMKWNGVQNGTTDPNFNHTSIDEKQNIMDYLNNNKLTNNN
ncbi:MAG TPA: hypothetical protein DCO75_11955 [Fibrobacteres bacterium]|nr:hypothetical protein [Fibrobacterota bacterium]